MDVNTKPFLKHKNKKNEKTSNITIGHDSRWHRFV